MITLDVNNAKGYYMIVSFADKDTRCLAELKRVRRFEGFERVALRKLRQLEVANSLWDLSVPPGNMLERLKGDRAGQYSIRINDQYRICFAWTEAGAENVEIVDYHA
ncbi:type II toxin-antitoxin system RelE/ParE family toxin [Adlercreutzia sp. ZJ305]|uniref:type II toxin-antitoxin system RelE/ParE family toxin n=2 Tax=unclassified Adlercreutzia TaxID=2636013 RepID=UPI001F14E90F|nr:type II toxin-antitoxin system RelE/ParE family toxin [Adlercreutzia sp. ZJ305]